MSRIDYIVESLLGEMKRPIDIGFEFIGKDMKKVKITHINPKAKNLPHWAKLGGEIDTKTATSAEANFEVYNTAGWTVSNGYIVGTK